MPDINEIIGIVLSCDGDSLRDSDSPKTIPKWDSMTHIILLSALEEEFGIAFSDNELADINTIGEIRNRVAEKTGMR